MSTFERFAFLTYETAAGYSMPYALSLPDGYDPAKSYPLVYFLHGAGERGRDKSALLRHCIREFFETRPEYFTNAIVLCPQCPDDEQWVDASWLEGTYSTRAVPESRAMRTAWAIFEKITAEYTVDRSRIYVVGLSMGGYGTWDVLARHGEVFAAGIPLCGGGDPEMADVLREIPIWTWHSRDDAVLFSGTADTVDAIRKAGGTKINFTDLNGFGHNVWHAASASGPVLDWLFAQRKND